MTDSKLLFSLILFAVFASASSTNKIRHFDRTSPSVYTIVVHFVNPLSFRGASATSEPGIHNHNREYGFRARAKRRAPE
jgi:hypothetical protein